jgi:hypothetical protein
MSWLWPRLLTALLSLLGASLLGWLVGYLTSGTPWRAALAGAAQGLPWCPSPWCWWTRSEHIG